MYAQGWIRGYMAKSYSTHKFIVHVVTTIERQLKLWNEKYEVSLLQDVRDEGKYFIKLTCGEKSYKLNLSEQHARLLQNQSPFTLDQYIWRELVNQGLIIGETEGNYLTYCAV